MSPEQLAHLLAEPTYTPSLSEADEGEMLGMIARLQQTLSPEEFQAFVLKLAREDEAALRASLPADAPILQLLDENAA